MLPEQAVLFIASGAVVAFWTLDVMAHAIVDWWLRA